MKNQFFNQRVTDAEMLSFRSPNLEEMMILQDLVKPETNLPAKICFVVCLVITCFLISSGASLPYYLILLIPAAAGIILARVLGKTSSKDELMVLYGTVLEKHIERPGSNNVFYISIWADASEQYCDRIYFSSNQYGRYNTLMPGDKVLVYKLGKKIVAKPVPAPLMKFAETDQH